MKLAILGPKGTFSHEAALSLDPQAELLFQRTIRDVFEQTAEGAAGAGLVPLENSVSGSVGDTLDAFTATELTIEKEVIHPVVQNLAGIAETSRIKSIFTHPQSYAQCEGFLHEHYPDAEIVPTSSNGKSAELLAESGSPDLAAILPEMAIDLYGLKKLRPAIQDNPFNVTRFVLVSEKTTQATSYDRTSLLLYPQIDHPGLLHDILGLLAARGINMSKIESRPAKGKLGDYIFFIDIQGHIQDTAVAEGLKDLSKKAFLKVLGSYPRQY
ncbi:MAG: prephenate dehydratase [Gemmatimonadota bacterium]|nr:prephenate dehydratase [Gemmatimonadota bacterium]